MIVNIHVARAQLSKLIERMEAGEEVIVARAGRPVARLAAPVANASVDAQEPPGVLSSWMGSLRGQIWIPPDVDGDCAETVRLMEEGTIFANESAGG
jgi:antitoxin (DNA-binding transcriptional repressor) of toxin-antitoxin stability system